MNRIKSNQNKTLIKKNQIVKVSPGGSLPHSPLFPLAPCHSPPLPSFPPRSLSFPLTPCHSPSLPVIPLAPCHSPHSLSFPVVPPRSLSFPLAPHHCPSSPLSPRPSPSLPVIPIAPSRSVGVRRERRGQGYVILGVRVPTTFVGARGSE